jgi:circadian clock protein KaiC
MELNVNLSRIEENTLEELAKAPTGIRGLDDITFGGIPKGRPTLIAGGAGSGKTLMSMEFLVRGATMFNEPGVFMAFEETPDELAKNVASLGFDVNQLIEQKKLLIDFVRVERNEIEETGEYDLEGLFIRLNYAIDSIGAKRVVMDTIESLFAGLSNQAILRAELRRLFRWLKDKGVTAIITAERGTNELTRYGLEEYVSDCVILLDHRVKGQISTRRLRVVKYRGSLHGTNEYPFIIDEKGISIMPITSLNLDYQVSSDRVPTGIPRLDAMLDGKGFYRGSSILISGTAGTGKSTIGATFANATCKRGERCLIFAFEESPEQIMRNMLSLGINLKQWVEKGLLKICAARASLYGLETHLVTMQRDIDDFKPSVVIVDPISNLISIGEPDDVRSMLTRLIDHLKSKQITAVFTNLTHIQGLESTESEVSSVMDTWILLRDIEIQGERNRGIYVLKSRGMPHSNQIREFLLTSKGIDIVNVYTGSAGVLTGSARLAQESKEKAEEENRKEETERLQRELERKRKITESQIAALQAELEAKADEIKKAILQEKQKEKTLSENRQEMSRARKADEQSLREQQT